MKLQKFRLFEVFNDLFNQSQEKDSFFTQADLSNAFIGVQISTDHDIEKNFISIQVTYVFKDNDSGECRIVFSPFLKLDKEAVKEVKDSGYTIEMDNLQKLLSDNIEMDKKLKAIDAILNRPNSSNNRDCIDISEVLRN